MRAPSGFARRRFRRQNRAQPGMPDLPRIAGHIPRKFRVPGEFRVPGKTRKTRARDGPREIDTPTIAIRWLAGSFLGKIYVCFFETPPLLKKTLCLLLKNAMNYFSGAGVFTK